MTGPLFKEFIEYFERQWIEKEGPESKCVFMESSRTNNLSESYNSNLDPKIAPSGCLFKFLQTLQKEEFVKSRECLMQMKGGTQLYPPQRKKFKERDDFIFKLQEKFQSGRINVEQFFDRIIDLKELAKYETEADSIPDDDTDDKENNANLTNTSTNRTCVSCLAADRNVILEPCNDFRFCEECAKKIMDTKAVKGVRARPKCPICAKMVSGYKLIFM